ncbi:MAG TPA: beta-ketoacyl-ACP synthase III [Thermoanaerobaculia bacterium]|nr:beta-ketoacyl-ACP synthase III [Thermoanaerobaculia bacterium]
MIRARIAGTGHAVPERRLTNADLERMVDTSDEWIVTRTGIKERRIVGADEATTSLAIPAARRALESAGVAPEEVDLVLCGTVTPDMLFPASSCLVQEALGARKAAAFDFNAGCSGFVYGLSIASQFIENGTARVVVLIGAEVLTRFVDWEDRQTCVLFGDGAGAVVLRAEEGERGVLASALHSDGALSQLICMPGGGSRRPASDRSSIDERLPFIKMRGSETFKVAVRSLAEVSDEVLAKIGLRYSDVRWLIPHQANRRIIDAVGQRLEIDPERVYVNVERFGNTSAASIPIALDELNRSGRLDEGDVVLLSAFGAGLTWAAAAIRW